MTEIEKQELESLRRQKREWEYERATMLAEMDFQRKRVNLCMEEYEALGEQFSRLLEIVGKLRSALGVSEAKLEVADLAPELEPFARPEYRPEAIDEVFDGPDDVDVEQMQSTADYDMEAMPGGND